MHKDSQARSFAKAISWRIWATLTTLIISLFVTGSIKLALSISSIEVVAKLVLYYAHERMWSVMLWGKGIASLESGRNQG